MFRTSEVRCEVQKPTMKFRFVYKVSDWLHVKSSQSNANFTYRFVNFIMSFRTLQRTSEIWNEVQNISVKS